MTQSMAAMVWAAGIVIWTIIRLPYRRRARRTKTVEDRRSSKERFMLSLTVVGLVVIPGFHLIFGLFKFANLAYSPLAGWFGALLMAGFLLLFYLSHKHLARNWSVSLEIRKDHELVDTGIYSKIRHPMYTSFWLWALAQFLLIPNWIAGLSGIISVAILYYGRIEAEEKMMRQQFGEAYDEYCSRTYRLLPKIF